MHLSIITATRNAAAKAWACLQSVSRQGLPVEHLVMDGASTDGTLSQLHAWKGHPLWVISEPDLGIYDAMNQGIARASGDVIGLLNADDFYASRDVLKQVAAVFEDPAVDACYGDLLYVDSDASEPSDLPKIGRSGRKVSRTVRDNLEDIDGQLC